MALSGIFTSSPKLNVPAGLVIALFKCARLHLGLFCFSLCLAVYLPSEQMNLKGCNFVNQKIKK